MIDRPPHDPDQRDPCGPSWEARHAVLLYVLLAFAISCPWWLPLALSRTATRSGQEIPQRFLSLVAVGA